MERSCECLFANSFYNVSRDVNWLKYGRLTFGFTVRDKVGEKLRDKRGVNPNIGVSKGQN
jgi:hypothetical protein